MQTRHVLRVTGADRDLPGLRFPVAHLRGENDVIANAMGGLLWLVIVGCLTVAMPVIGIATLVAGALIVLRVRAS
ncbi:hypothetical protein [Amycolatopsis thermoflava]|uniref:hypothetical protein n=1 Tax=Amycolatopsis thermoflava TaxID=84480 RepID=UPI00364A2DBD